MSIGYSRNRPEGLGHRAKIRGGSCRDCGLAAEFHRPLDGAVPGHQRRRRRAAYAAGAGGGGNSNRDAGDLARAADLRRGRGEGAP